MKKIIAIFAVLVLCISLSYSVDRSASTGTGKANVSGFINPVDIEVSSSNANIYLGEFPQGNPDGTPYVKHFPADNASCNPLDGAGYPNAVFEFYGGKGWNVELSFSTTLASDSPKGLTLTADGTVTDKSGVHTPVNVHTGTNTFAGTLTADEGKFTFKLRILTATMAPDAEWGTDGSHEITFSGQLSYN